MQKMTYFRRPQLAGKALRRPSSPMLRGSLRRKNPDGVSTVPYFAGLPNGGGTVVIESFYDPGQPVATVTAVVTASVAGVASLAAVITSLNAQLSAAKVLAFDDGGCIGLASTSLYPAEAWVRVTGGTAAAALGFDAVVRQYVAKAGDLKSAPEGHIGNLFGTALPSPGEDFDSDAVARALGRMMSNMDVLHADLVREEAVIAKVTDITGPLSVVDLPVELRVFTAGTPNATKVLTPASTKAELSRFFYLVDQVTGQVAQSAVSGVLDAADTPILGVEQSVLLNVSITDIPAGDVIKISGDTSTVAAGDYVKIASADNGPWRNNGYRWVVEEVPAAGTLRLRPMSKVELDQVGEETDESQPLVELCTEKAPGETYGTASVYRSPFSSGIKLQFDPPVPPDASYDVYAAVPASGRSRSTSATIDSLQALFASFVQSQGMLADGVLTAPLVGEGPGFHQVNVGEFYVRWHGRVARIPAQTVDVPFNETDTGYVYFNQETCAVEAGGTAGEWLLASCQLLEGGFAVLPARRLDSLPQDVVTVGEFNCNFVNLNEAARYISSLSTNRARIILTESQTLAETCDLPPGATVEGADESIILKASGGVGSLFNANTSVDPASSLDIKPALRNLTVVLHGEQSLSNNPGVDLHLFNVIISTDIIGSATRYYLDNTNIQIKDSIVDPGGTKVNSTVEVLFKTLDETPSNRRSISLDLNSLLLTSNGVASRIDGTGISTDGALDVNGGADIVGTLTVHNDINSLAGKKIGLGSTGGSEGAHLWSDGVQGVLLLSKNGESDVSLTKDKLDLLVGNPGAVDADSLHTHASKANDSAVLHKTNNESKNGSLEMLDAGIVFRAAAALSLLGAGIAQTIKKDANGDFIIENASSSPFDMLVRSLAGTVSLKANKTLTLSGGQDAVVEARGANGVGSGVIGDILFKIADTTVLKILGASGMVDAMSHRITAVADPSNPQDAATMKYVGDRETAITAAYGAADAASIAPVDGTSGIVWQTDWADHDTDTRVSRVGKMVSLALYTDCLTTLSTILTLPSGFRPDTLIIAVGIDRTTDTPVQFTVSKFGQVSKYTNAVSGHSYCLAVSFMAL